MKRRVITWKDEFFPYSAAVEYATGAIVIENDELYIAIRKTKGEGLNSSAFKLFEGFQTLDLFDSTDLYYHTLCVHQGDLALKSQPPTKPTIQNWARLYSNEANKPSGSRDNTAYTTYRNLLQDADLSMMEDLSDLFNDATPYNLTGLSLNWDLRSCKNATNAFKNVKMDTGAIIIRNADQLINATSMFEGMNSSTQNGVVAIQSNSIVNATRMFANTVNLYLTVDLTSFGTENIEIMDEMFSNSNFDIITNLETFKLPKITDLKLILNVFNLGNTIDFSKMHLPNVVTSVTDVVSGDTQTISDDRKPIPGFYNGPMTRDQLNYFIERWKTDTTNVNFQNTIKYADVSQIQDLSYLNLGPDFNIDISGWDTSSATTMAGMFKGATTFDQDVSGFVLDNVTDTSEMFSDCFAFTSGINTWNTSNVTNMAYMFNQCNSFNKPVFSLDTSKVTNMEGMFKGASIFNQDLTLWDVSNVENMDYMFDGAISFNGGN